jgi:cobalt-zinc-cadmium resistance protein CzcA
MLLSLTLMPVLASLGLGTRTEHRGNALMSALLRVYRPILHGALRRPGLVIAVALLVLANAGFLATRLGSEFIPRLLEGTVVINTVRLAGVSLDESVRYGTRIERTLLDGFPDEIERVWTRSGSAEIATDPMGVEVSDVFVTLRPRAQWRRADTQPELVAEMAEDLSSLPGMRMIFSQPIEMRVNEMIAGIRADVGIKLFGDDFDVLRGKAAEIAAVLGEIPGAADVLTEQISGQPVLEVRADRQAIGRQGIPVAQVLEAVEALGPRQSGVMQDGEIPVPIALRLDERYRTDPEAVKQVLVSGENGHWIPLGRLASVTIAEAPSTITREWGKRRIVVQANVRGRDVGSFVNDVREAIASEVELPPGYFVRYGGQFEHLEQARTRLLIVVPIALGLIFVMLLFTYRRVIDALRVFTGVPFAAVGGILALWLRDMPFSISAGVGFVALSGVSVLADMVLVSMVRQRLAAGRSVRQAVEEAAETRLRPVLMTALVASFGFVPMALNTGFGAEVQRPLATVVVGGVMSSTLLTLVVLPVLYVVTQSRAARSGAVASDDD